MSEHVYLGRQPILDNNGALFAYDLFYRNNKVQHNISDYQFATANVLTNTLNKFGVKNIVGEHKAFIKVDGAFLLHELVLSIPSEFFIFSILDSIEMNQNIIDRIKMLKERGFEFALNDTKLCGETIDKFEPLFKHINYVKVDSLQCEGTNVDADIERIKSSGVKVIASKIETLEAYERYSAAGADLFQGYFFAKPKTIENDKFDPEQFSVIKLCNLLLSEASIDEIAKEFEANHAISIQLIQFMNSGAFHFKKQISSIRHVLTLMGRYPVAQWLLLMVYAKSVNSGTQRSPLLIMVKNRTTLMSSLIKLLRPNASNELVGEAYFVGVLSLIETIFMAPLQKVLDTLNVSEDVRSALIDHHGELGKLYDVVDAIEHFDTRRIEEFTVEYNLPSDAFEEVLANSIEESNEFESSFKAS